MAKSALTGSRIRERRQALQIKQAELAREAGISASYLNLIEHNRRKIGGKVLLEIARILKTDVIALTEGAEEALLEALREAAAVARKSGAEADRMEEFVARFPGWANLIAAQRRRLLAQERAIEALNDRLTHDPALAEQLHDILSNVTAIGSTAHILAEEAELEPAWRDRFHRNLLEESQRLAAGSQRLISYFEDQVQAETPFTTPLEALDGYLLSRDYHLPELEAASRTAAAGEIEVLLAQAPVFAAPQARALGRDYLKLYHRLSQRLPAEAVIAAWGRTGDPAAIAAEFGVPLMDVLGRLATLPGDQLGTRLGLIVTDAAGALLFRKAIDGFPVPRFGAACAVWPVFEALSRPMQGSHLLLETPPGRRFEAWVLAAPATEPGFDGPPPFRAAMLIAPDRGRLPAEAARPVGTTCRICPRERCPARREPSILLG